MQASRPNPKEEEWQYRSIFDATYDGVIIIDLENGLVVEANPAACKMHGFTREDFIGLPLMNFIHPDNRHVFVEHIHAIRSGSMLDARILHTRRDGSTFHAEWRGTAYTYQGQSCLLGAVRDVSKRVQAEQALHQRVETRTRWHPHWNSILVRSSINCGKSSIFHTARYSPWKTLL